MILSPLQIVAIGVAALFLCLSAFVSGSEIAFFSLDEAERRDLDDTSAGPRVMALLGRPQRLLATILIANNLANVSIVVLLNFSLGPVFEGMPSWASFVLQTVILTFLILLFGEIIPKLYANSYPVAWVTHAVGMVNALVKIFHPLSALLVRSTAVVNHLVPKKPHDISADMLSQALEITDVDAAPDRQMLKGILSFGDTNAARIMTSRMDMTAIDADTPFDEVIRQVTESGFSRLPVYRDSPDQIIGLLYSRDLLPHLGHRDEAEYQWLPLLRQPYFVPESRMIDDLLEDFRKMKIHMAVVVDEFGGTQGIVTMEDVLEEIVGDIDDEYDDADTRTYRRLGDDTYLFEGRTPITDFFRVTGLEADDYEEVIDGCDTLAGMLLAIKGDFPHAKEPLAYGRLRMLVLDLSERRINNVRVKVMPPDPDKDE